MARSEDSMDRFPTAFRGVVSMFQGFSHVVFVCVGIALTHRIYVWYVYM